MPDNALDKMTEYLKDIYNDISNEDLRSQFKNFALNWLSFSKSLKEEYVSCEIIDLYNECETDSRIKKFKKRR